MKMLGILGGTFASSTALCWCRDCAVAYAPSACMGQTEARKPECATNNTHVETALDCSISSSGAAT
jgi:hypothetical protein